MQSSLLLGPPVRFVTGFDILFNTFICQNVWSCYKFKWTNVHIFQLFDCRLENDWINNTQVSVAHIQSPEGRLHGNIQEEGRQLVIRQFCMSKVHNPSSTH